MGSVIGDETRFGIFKRIEGWVWRKISNSWIFSVHDESYARNKCFRLSFDILFTFGSILLITVDLRTKEINVVEKGFQKWGKERGVSANKDNSVSKETFSSVLCFFSLRFFT